MFRSSQAIFSSFGFWYFGHFSCEIFFPSSPSCLAKCKQRLRNIFCIFLTLFPKVTKNQKREMEWTKKRRQRKILVHCIFFTCGIEYAYYDHAPPFWLLFLLVIVIEGSWHSQMGQKVRFAPSTNSWGGKLHDDVSDLIHMLCTAQLFEKNYEVEFEFF